MSGLQINFDKSEVMVIGYSPAKSQSITNRLKCQLGSFPTSYLWIPISATRLSVADLRPMVLKLQHRIEPWQGRWLSNAARMVLINSSLTSLLMFIMSFYSLPETPTMRSTSFTLISSRLAMAISKSIIWSAGRTYANHETKAALALCPPSA